MLPIQSCAFFAFVSLACLSWNAQANEQDTSGWYHWRGPDQNGSSRETGLIDSIEVGGKNQAWTYPISGRGTPVIAHGRLYTMAYEVTGGPVVPATTTPTTEGDDVEHEGGPNLQELLLCLDAQTGHKLWEHRFSDFINDSIYNRYALGSPTIDPQSRHVYCQTSPGLLTCFSEDGQFIWQKSMMEESGRLTFPNGRVGAPVIDDDLVIVHAITASWGPDQGPARDRFFAYEKASGATVWVATPGLEPKDSSYSSPVLEWRDGKRLLYAGTGDGHIVCINARNGDTLWRFNMTIGGVNCSPVLYKDRLIAIHDTENLDSSEMGRMVAIKLGAMPGSGDPRPMELSRSFELWRNNLGIFTSSPVLGEECIYQTVHTGKLCAVDPESGKILWEKKYALDQVHASPLFADGKLYVPMNDGSFHIVRPKPEGPETLCSVQLAGSCLAAPSTLDGRIYVHTTKALYCFADSSRRIKLAETLPAERLQVIPADVLMSPGDCVSLRVRSLDTNGLVIDEDVQEVAFQSKTALKVGFDSQGQLLIAPDSPFGTAMFKATSGNLEGSLRLRIVPGNSYSQDFNDVALTEPHYNEPGVMMAFPPSHWLAAKVKWEVRDLDGERVLAKRLDNNLFQRSYVPISHPDSSHYTAQVDIMTDGTPRFMNSAGLIHQRYLIVMKGNAQEIEISSNHERIKESVEFAWKPKIWYTLKSRVDILAGGSTLIRAKAWQRDQEEPSNWNIEYTHLFGHHHGSFGIFGYTLQSRYRLYLDNLLVTPNASAAHSD